MNMTYYNIKYQICLPYSQSANGNGKSTLTYSAWIYINRPSSKLFKLFLKATMNCLCQNQNIQVMATITQTLT